MKNDEFAKPAAMRDDVDFAIPTFLFRRRGTIMGPMAGDPNEIEGVLDQGAARSRDR